MSTTPAGPQGTVRPLQRSDRPIDPGVRSATSTCARPTSTACATSTSACSASTSWPRRATSPAGARPATSSSSRAGGYHHHLGFNTWKSAGGGPQPDGVAGLHHVALNYPTRAGLADAVRRLQEAGWPLRQLSDYGTHEAVYLSDPDGNDLELCWDRPPEEWPLEADGRAKFVFGEPRPGGPAARGAVTDVAAPGRARVGPLLRDWRRRRRMSQLDLALRGRRVGAPRELRRDRAGAAERARWCCTWPSTSTCRCATATGCCWPPATRPRTAQRGLDEPEMGPVREAIDRLLRGPRAVSRRSSSTATGAWSPPTAPVALLTEGVAAELLEPPVNVLRVSLHPDGMAPRIANLGRVARTPARPAGAPGGRDGRPGARRAARRALGATRRRGARADRAAANRRAAAAARRRRACSPSSAPSTTSARRPT